MTRNQDKEKLTMVRSALLGLASFGLTATMIVATTAQGSALFGWTLPRRPANVNENARPRLT